MIEVLNTTGSILILVGLPTAILDMMMNGGRYADWAPYGLFAAGLGIILVCL